jgi:hypothetical protein
VLHDGIPYPDGTKWLLVWEDEKKIYEEEIPDPPEVEITGTEPHQEGVILKWRGISSIGLIKNTASTAALRPDSKTPRCSYREHCSPMTRDLRCAF